MKLHKDPRGNDRFMVAGYRALKHGKICDYPEKS
jgi:hypothetical protein